MMHRWRTDVETADDGALRFVVTILDRDGGPVMRRRLADGERVEEVALGMIWQIQRGRGA